jgi:hypothetical protein
MRMKVFGQLLRRLSNLFKKQRRDAVDLLVWPILVGIILISIGVGLIGLKIGSIGASLLILGSGIFYICLIVLAWVL